MNRKNPMFSLFDTNVSCRYADPKTLVRRIKELLVHLVIKAKTAAIIAPPVNNTASSAPKSNLIVPTETNTIVIDDDVIESEEPKLPKDATSTNQAKSPESRPNAFSRVFILRGMNKSIQL
jgi:hypothetical protein